ncbi:MAG: hypothetical protein IKE93_06770 [Erysipelotrichaceae bacterium]|nr:hypothetical protein [Erysipelotrichaceae bacterium]MBR2746610.1 hypothetical protein [Erysipelotrichaceae bacterium]
MESNSQGRKKHMVEGTVQKIARTDEVVKDVREDLVNAADAGAKLKGAGRKKGFFAMIADLFKK